MQHVEFAFQVNEGTGWVVDEDGKTEYVSRSWPIIPRVGERVRLLVVRPDDELVFLEAGRTKRLEGTVCAVSWGDTVTGAGHPIASEPSVMIELEDCQIEDA